MTILADPAEMIRLGAPHIIRNDDELEAYTIRLLELSALDKRSHDQEEAVELLTLLIERYEDERFPIPEAGPVQVLRFLIDQHGLSQRDLIPEIGAESTVSQVLSGKRKLNRDHIERLSKRFHVSPAVFF